VARLIAGIKNCRATTAINITKATQAALNESNPYDSGMTKLDETITKR
jgi:hypothetical protein